MASFVQIKTEKGMEYINMDNVLYFVESGNKQCMIHFVDGSKYGLRNTEAINLLPRGIG